MVLGEFRRISLLRVPWRVQPSGFCFRVSVLVQGEPFSVLIYNRKIHKSFFPVVFATGVLLQGSFFNFCYRGSGFPEQVCVHCSFFRFVFFHLVLVFGYCNVLILILANVFWLV